MSANTVEFRHQSGISATPRVGVGARGGVQGGGDCTSRPFIRIKSQFFLITF